MTIFAYTGATGKGYPSFVSINRTKDGDVKITVRGDATERRRPGGRVGYMVEGPQVEVVVPAAEWDQFHA